ncbi:hydrogenase [Pseudonocardia yunnanensis]|uniref:Hydrogenase n=1 Tax=Pseudonocardia yunnanensis TaxID=58107 RepID=A0ABW4F2V9_9PSEU
MQSGDRRMMWHGMFLFLIGLVTGLLERRFKNMRMGVSAHLEGVMNGTFLIALGAVWGYVKLPRRADQAARASALYGTYGNWLFTTLGAALGTAAANPISSAGHTGKPWQEKLVGAGFLSIAISIIVSAVLTLFGLGRKAPTAEKSGGEQDSTPARRVA